MSRYDIAIARAATAMIASADATHRQRRPIAVLIASPRAGPLAQSVRAADS